MMDHVRSTKYYIRRFMSETGKMPKERDTGVGVVFFFLFLKRDDNELDAERDHEFFVFA